MSTPLHPRAASVPDDSSAGATLAVPSAESNALAVLDDLYQQQLCGAAAEIAAAIAHAAGTPLNVISGRAELIRQDPSNALPQVTRIEEQVRKLADGLRDFVEYLTVSSGVSSSGVSSSGVSSSGVSSSGVSSSGVSSSGVLSSGVSSSGVSAGSSSGAGGVADAAASADVPAAQLLKRACSLLRPVLDQHGVELLVEDAALATASVAQRSLSNLVTLLSWAARCTAAAHVPGERKLQLGGSALESTAGGGAVFELRLPGLVLPEHWRIERFEASAPSSESEAFRMMAICASVARGQGGKLQAETLPDGGGVRVRLLVRATS